MPGARIPAHDEQCPRAVHHTVKAKIDRGWRAYHARFSSRFFTMRTARSADLRDAPTSLQADMLITPWAGCARGKRVRLSAGYLRIVYMPAARHCFARGARR